MTSLILAQAAVNRVWAELMGRGIVQPVDDFRISNPPTNEPLLQALAIGVNAARYALARTTTPVPVQVDNWARLRLIVKTTLLHRRETEEVRDQPPMEWRFDWEPDV